MRLDEWVDKQAKSAGTSRTAVLHGLKATCGVSLMTLQQVAKGARMNRYDKAKAISEATKGKVTIAELCE